MRSFYLLTLFLILFLYTIYGRFYSTSTLETLYNLLSFLPFIIAAMLLELNIGFNIKKVLFYFTICTAIGAIYANVIQLLYPDILSVIIGDGDIDKVLSWGRVSWIGYVVPLPLITQFLYLKIYSKKEQYILIPSLIIAIVGTILTFNRTPLIALVILLLYIIVSTINKINFKKIILLVSLIFICIISINYIQLVNPNFQNLLDYRVLGFFTGKSDISEDLSTRYDLYSQYKDAIYNSYFLGQGFGIPYSIKPEPKSWSDITFISFIIPLGIIGVVYFLIFLKKVFISIRNKISSIKIRRSFYLVFFLAILISLNDDIWSHKNFPIYFVFIINSFGYKFNELKNKTDIITQK